MIVVGEVARAEGAGGGRAAGGVESALLEGLGTSAGKRSTLHRFAPTQAWTISPFGEDWPEGDSSSFTPTSRPCQTSGDGDWWFDGAKEAMVAPGA
jgi:hypothetical protein